MYSSFNIGIYIYVVVLLWGGPFSNIIFVRKFFPLFHIQELPCSNWLFIFWYQSYWSYIWWFYTTSKVWHQYHYPQIFDTDAAQQVLIEPLVVMILIELSLNTERSVWRLGVRIESEHCNGIVQCNTRQDIGSHLICNMYSMVVQCITSSNYPCLLPRKTDVVWKQEKS